MSNKRFIYETIIKSIWTHGIALWGMAVKSHTAKMEALQSIIFRTIVNAPWYVRNEQIRSHLMIRTVKEEIKYLCNRYKTGLENYPNKLYSEDFPRRLRRKHPNDLFISTQGIIIEECILSRKHLRANIQQTARQIYQMFFRDKL